MAPLAEAAAEEELPPESEQPQHKSEQQKITAYYPWQDLSEHSVDATEQIVAQREEDTVHGSTGACRELQVSTEDIVQDRENVLVNLISTTRTESRPDDPYERESLAGGVGTPGYEVDNRIVNDIRTRESSEMRHSGIRRSRDPTGSVRETRRARRR